MFKDNVFFYIGLVTYHLFQISLDLDHKPVKSPY